jgi:hypothetical protein
LTLLQNPVRIYVNNPYLDLLAVVIINKRGISVKNKINFLGIIALVLIIGFSIASCKNDEDESSIIETPPATSFGNTMTLSGRVYLIEEDYDRVNYIPFSGSMGVSSPYIGTTGQINNGNLNYIVGTPYYLQTFYADDWLSDYYYYNMTSSRPVRGAIITGFQTESNSYPYLTKGLITMNLRNNSASFIEEQIAYFYVEDDVTVSARGRTLPPRYVDGGISNYVIRDVNLALKAGWNTVYSKRDAAATFSGTINNPTNINMTETMSISVNNPSNLRWIMEERSYNQPTIPPSSYTDLTSGQWYNANVYSSDQWYRFYVIQGTTYYVWWNDGYSGDGSKTLDIIVSAYYSNGTPIFWEEDSAWTFPIPFYSSSSGYIYLKVEPYTGGSTGTYAITYNTNSSRPSYAMSFTEFASPAFNTVLKEDKKSPESLNPVFKLFRQMRQNRR